LGRSWTRSRPASPTARPRRSTSFRAWPTRWIIACETGLGWTPGTFLASYRGNRAQAHELAIDASLVGPYLRQLAEAGFEGTATELLARLNDLADEKVQKLKDWPTTGRKMSGELRRLAPPLRKLGYIVELDEREPTRGRKRLLRLGTRETVQTVRTVRDVEKSLLSDESVSDGRPDGSDSRASATVQEEKPASDNFSDGADGLDGGERWSSDSVEDALAYYREKAAS
jgi:hypothetical protein